MDIRRLKRAVLVGIVATVVILALGAIAVVLDLGSSSEARRDVTVSLQVVTDTPDYYWAAVYVAEPLTLDEYKKIAKSVADEHFRGRFGQVQVFDDEWARDMMLPEHQPTDLTSSSVGPSPVPG